MHNLAKMRYWRTGEARYSETWNMSLIERTFRKLKSVRDVSSL